MRRSANAGSVWPWLLRFGSVSFRFLHRKERTIDMVGEPDAAGLGEGLGIFVAQERAPHADGAFAAERPFALDRGEHLVEHRVEEHRLEIDRRLLRPGLGVSGNLGVGGDRKSV